MYFHFVDFEKAFVLVHRDSLWKIMRAYGIPGKLIGMAKALYDGFTCAVIKEGEITERFPVVTGVKQGCCMSSGFLFLLVIDWVMRKTVDGQRTGIRWDFTRLLEDIDYVRRRPASTNIKGRPHAGKVSRARARGESRQSRIEVEPTEVQVDEGRQLEQ